MHKPVTIGSRMEGFARRQGLDMHILHVTNMDESGKENDRQRRAVVLNELPHVALQEVAFSEHAAPIGEAEHQEADHNREVSTRLTGQAPLSSEHLNTFLQVDEGDVEAEGV